MYYICGMTRTEANIQLFVSPAQEGVQNFKKDSQKGLRTLAEVRECNNYHQLFTACIAARDAVRNHLDDYLWNYKGLNKETFSRKVGKHDILMLFPDGYYLKGLRKKMATWTNIKAPEDLSKLPAHKVVHRMIRILFMRNRNEREKAVIRFNPYLEGMRVPTTTEVFLAVLAYYIYDILKRPDLLFVYKNALLRLFRRELSRMCAIGYSKFCKETREMFPESFYTDGKAHFKCFKEDLTRVEKACHAKKERKNTEKEIIDAFFKMAINPNVAHRYFKKTGGNKPSLLREINKRLTKKGFSSISERTLNRHKARIIKEWGINIKEILKADKSLYKEHTKVRKEFTKKRMTMKERVDIIRFVLQGKDPSEVDVIAYYSQHLPPWQRIDTWTIPIDNLYPS